MLLRQVGWLRSFRLLPAIHCAAKLLAAELSHRFRRLLRYRPSLVAQFHRFQLSARHSPEESDLPGRIPPLTFQILPCWAIQSHPSTRSAEEIPSWSYTG